MAVWRRDSMGRASLFAGYLPIDAASARGSVQGNGTQRAARADADFY